MILFFQVEHSTSPFCLDIPRLHSKHRKALKNSIKTLGKNSIINVPWHSWNAEGRKRFRSLTGSKVFNAEETNVKLYIEKYRVFAKKSTKDVYEITKFSITVMFAFLESGNTMERKIIYQLERIPARAIHCVPPSLSIVRKSNVWMTTQMFYERIGSAFAFFLVRNDAKVILFINGHKRHLTCENNKLCKSHR